MKHKKLKMCTLLLLSIGIQAVMAQTSLYVKEKAGIITPFDLITVKSITFAGGSLMVNKKDATINSFALADLSYLSFNLSTGFELINATQTPQLMVFPNPVRDVLYIDYAQSEKGNIQVEILSINGKVVLKTLLDNTTNSISVAHLECGFYLLRVQNGTKKGITKFIKQ